MSFKRRIIELEFAYYCNIVDMRVVVCVKNGRDKAFGESF